MASVTNRIILLIVFWQLLPILPVDSGPTRGNAYHLPQFSNDMSTLARITNAVALGMRLNDKKVDLDVLSGELLNLGPNVTMRGLEGAGLVGLDTELETICAAVETECGGTDGCGKQTVLSAGVKVFEDIDTKPFEEATTALKSTAMDEVKTLAGYLKVMETGGGGVQELITTLGRTNTVDKDSVNEFRYEVGDRIKKAVLSIEALKNSLTHVESATRGNITDVISKVLVLKNISSSLPAHEPALDSFKTEVSSLSKKINTLSAFFAKESIEKLKKKSSVLKDLAGWRDRMYEKVVSQGFPNGLKDVDQLARDLDSEFVKKTLGNGQNLNELKKSAKPLTALRTDLTSTQNSLANVKFPASKSIQTVRDLLQAASSEVTGGFKQVVSSLESYYNCIKNVNLKNAFRFDDIELSLNKAKELDQKMIDFSTTFKTKLPTTLKDNLVDIQKLLTKDPTESLNKLKSYQKMNDVIRDLGTFKTTLDEVEDHDLSEHVDDISKKVPKISPWLDELNIATAASCMSQSRIQSTQVQLDHPSLLKLKPNNVDVTSLRTAAKSMKDPIDAWKTFLASKRLKRATGGQKKLDDMEPEFKRIVDGAVKIRVLSDAYTSRADIRKFMESSKSIDADIQGLQEKAKRDSANSVWTDSLKTFLSSLPGFVESLDKGLPANRTTLTNFKKVWDTAANFHLPAIDVGKFTEMFQSINNPPGTGPVLQFVRGYQQFPSSSQPNPLASLQSFFDGLLNINRNGDVASYTSTPEAVTSGGLGSLAIIGIVVGVLCIIGIVIGTVYYVLWKRKKQKQEKEAKETEVTIDGDATFRNLSPKAKAVATQKVLEAHKSRQNPPATPDSGNTNTDVLPKNHEEVLTRTNIEGVDYIGLSGGPVGTQDVPSSKDDPVMHKKKNIKKVKKVKRMEFKKKAPQRKTVKLNAPSSSSSQFSTDDEGKAGHNLSLDAPKGTPISFADIGKKTTTGMIKILIRRKTAKSLELVKRRGEYREFVKANYSAEALVPAWASNVSTVTQVGEGLEFRGVTYENINESVKASENILKAPKQKRTNFPIQDPSSKTATEGSQEASAEQSSEAYVTVKETPSRVSAGSETGNGADVEKGAKGEEQEGSVTVYKISTHEDNRRRLRSVQKGMAEGRKPVKLRHLPAKRKTLDTVLLMGYGKLPKAPEGLTDAQAFFYGIFKARWAPRNLWNKRRIRKLPPPPPPPRPIYLSESYLGDRFSWAFKEAEENTTESSDECLRSTQPEKTEKKEQEENCARNHSGEQSLTDRASAAGELPRSDSNLNLRTAEAVLPLSTEGKENIPEKQVKKKPKKKKKDVGYVPLDKSATQEQKLEHFSKWADKCLKDDNYLPHNHLALMLDDVFTFTEDWRGYKNGKYPFPYKLVMIVLKLATILFSQEPDLLEIDGSFTGFGDLHGNVRDLILVLIGRGVDIFNSDEQYLFCGDYADRGKRGLCVIMLMCCLKIKSPTRFHFLRGNHELRRISTRYGLWQELNDLFNEEEARKIFDAIQEMFEHLPVAAVLNSNAFACHGLPSCKALLEKDGLKLIKKRPTTDVEKNVFDTLLWGDPNHILDPVDPENTPVYPPSTRRVPGVKDGNMVVVRKFLKQHNLKVIFRGHQMHMTGFDDEFGDGSCWTVYSASNSRDINNDDNKSNNYGGIFLLRPNYYCFERIYDKTMYDPDGSDVDELTVDDEPGLQAKNTNKAPTVGNKASGEKQPAKAVTKGPGTLNQIQNNQAPPANPKHPPKIASKAPATTAPTVEKKAPSTKKTTPGSKAPNTK